MTDEIFAPRTPWPSPFPAVVIHTDVASRDNHPDYLKAKSGDHQAATRLAVDLINCDAVHQLFTRIANATKSPILVPVGAIETMGYNAIPMTMAGEISRKLSWLLDNGELRQINKVGHTRAKSGQRIVTPPLFAGIVTPGQDYVLVDDHVGVGGTLANLRGYIESAGGRVVAMTTLTESQNGRHLALMSNTRDVLESNYGQELDTYWRNHFGYGIECLTEAEARLLARQSSFDAIRRFLSKAADEADHRGLSPIASLTGKTLGTSG
jgi:hypothetical protein